MGENISNAGRRLVGTFGALTGVLMVGVMLAGPSSATVDPVTGAIDDLQSKVTLYGGALIALVVIAVGLAIGMKYLGKAKSHA